jgi:hypothetical protein
VHPSIKSLPLVRFRPEGLVRSEVDEPLYVANGSPVASGSLVVRIWSGHERAIPLGNDLLGTNRYSTIMAVTMPKGRRP